VDGKVGSEQALVARTLRAKTLCGVVAAAEPFDCKIGCTGEVLEILPDEGELDRVRSSHVPVFADLRMFCGVALGRKQQRDADADRK
jgi:hypothetical protein